MPIVFSDAVPAQWHGRARTHLEKKGCPPSFVDGQIAGIAGAGISPSSPEIPPNSSRLHA